MEKYNSAKVFMQKCFEQTSETNSEDKETKDTIIFISNLIEKEESAPIGNKREQIYRIIERILTGAVTIRAEEISANFYHVKVFDRIERELVANLAFEKVLGQYHIKHYEILMGELYE